MNPLMLTVLCLTSTALFLNRLLRISFAECSCSPTHLNTAVLLWADFFLDPNKTKNFQSSRHEATWNFIENSLFLFAFWYREKIKRRGDRSLKDNQSVAGRLTQKQKQHRALKSFWRKPFSFFLVLRSSQLSAVLVTGISGSHMDDVSEGCSSLAWTSDKNGDSAEADREPGVTMSSLISGLVDSSSVPVMFKSYWSLVGHWAACVWWTGSLGIWGCKILQMWFVATPAIVVSRVVWFAVLLSTVSSGCFSLISAKMVWTMSSRTEREKMALLSCALGVLESWSRVAFVTQVESSLRLWDARFKRG